MAIIHKSGVSPHAVNYAVGPPRRALISAAIRISSRAYTVYTRIVLGHYSRERGGPTAKLKALAELCLIKR